MPPKPTLMLIAVTLATSVVTACSSPDSSPPPTLATPSTSADEIPTMTGAVVVDVDCGDDGVADVRVMNRATQLADALVGRNPTTLASGGRKTFSEHYTAEPGSLEALLTVTTSPTTGTCKTTITDYQSGNVVVQRETSGKAFLEVVVKPPPS